MPTRTLKRGLRAIATRTLRETSSDAAIQVRIGRPRRPRNKSDWTCEFQIRGLGDDRIRRAMGVDSLQALILTLEGVRRALEQSGFSLTWIGGEDGEHGVPRAVPAFFGRRFSARIDKMIDKEIAKFGHNKGRQTRSRG